MENPETDFFLTICLGMMHPHDLFRTRSLLFSLFFKFYFKRNYAIKD